MIGERVGNYVITQKLGEGGMGEVYQAEHPQIGKKVALKVLHPELAANPEITTRFFHEAKAVNDIQHPSIVDILDFGAVATERGQLVYLVMELLAGQTLSDVLRAGALDEPRAIRIARQVADALRASHERGIVHRDLKPDNIMLVTQGRETDMVKLLDFGIAKVEGNTTKTRTGMVMGTPAYMSPEQCEGRGELDHRSDIYALGCVVFEMLAGRAPFVAEGYAQLLVQHMTEPPPPLSSLRPDVSPFLELVVTKALQKRPDDRFASMRDLATALRDPQGFVQAHGGSGAFVPAALPTPMPGRAHSMTGPQMPGSSPRSHPMTGPQLPSSTTLSQSVGQLSTGGTVPPVARGGKTGWILAGVATVVAAAVGIYLVLARVSDKSEAKPAAAAPSDEAVAETAPTPMPAPPAANPAPPPPPPQPAPPSPPTTVKLSFVTKPERAAIHFANEAKPRCLAPCEFDVDRADGEATITITLAGFADAKRVVRLDANATLEVPLVKKHTATTTSSRPRPTTTQKPRPVGDNTLNPFE